MRHSDRSQRTPYVKPVKRIEISEKNTTLRLVLVVALLAIGAASLGFGLFGLLNTEPGWSAIEVSSREANCSQEFLLNYDFSDYGSSTTAKNKELITLYTEATIEAYQIFNPDVQQEGLNNLHFLNAHPNEIVEVDQTLYRALSLVQQYGNRNVFLAPVYVEYNRIFLYENETDAQIFDPGQNPELVTYIREAAAFANDPDMIDLELLDDFQVRLKVSDAYLDFIQEYEIGALVDFGWMKNAFIADYLADVLVEHGFTSGYLASYDGFTRNLDSRGGTYSMNLFDRKDNLVNLPAVMEYSGPLSVVFLRNYPMVDLDRWHYYSFSNGRIATVFIDPSDGMSKSSVNNLVSYSERTGCAEILLQMVQVFIADEFMPDAVNAVANDQVYSIWFEDSVIRYNDSAISLKLTGKDSSAPYTIADPAEIG